MCVGLWVCRVRIPEQKHTDGIIITGGSPRGRESEEPELELHQIGAAVVGSGEVITHQGIYYPVEFASIFWRLWWALWRSWWRWRKVFAGYEIR